MIAIFIVVDASLNENVVYDNDNDKNNDKKLCLKLKRRETETMYFSESYENYNIYEKMITFINTNDNDLQYHYISNNYEKNYKQEENLLFYSTPPIPIPQIR